MANPTSNYGWVLPTSTDLVTDLPADFDVALQGVDTRLKALQPGTTLGDLAYSSATANTNTRLPIGTNGQVLGVSGGVPAWVTSADQTPLTTKGDLFTFTTVDARLGVGANDTVLTADSTQPTGLKWAAPAGAGANWSAVNAGGTSLSGTNSVTVSGITAADKLMVYFYNVSSANASSIISLRLSGDTGGNYYTYGKKLNVPSAYATTYQAQLLDNLTSIRVAQNANTHFGLVSGYFMLSGGNAAGDKMYHGAAGIDSDSGSGGYGNTFGGRWNNSSTVSSVTILSSTGNFDNGDIFVWKSA